MKSTIRSFTFIWGILLLVAVSASASASRPQMLKLKDMESGKISTVDLPRHSTAEGPMIVRRDDQTGMLRFLSVPNGSVIPVAGQSAAAPGLRLDALQAAAESTALYFLDQMRPLLISDPQHRVGFEITRTSNVKGRFSVRLQQTYSGIPVFGSEVIVQVLPGEGVVALTSDIMQRTQSLDALPDAVSPVLDAEKAVEASKRDVASQNDVVQAQLVSTQPRLALHAPEVIGDAGDPRLCWNFLLGLKDSPPSEDVLVDARNGEIVQKFPQSKGVLYRSVYVGSGRLPLGWSEAFPYRYNQNPNYHRTGGLRRWEEENWTNGELGWPANPAQFYTQAPHQANRAFEYLGQAYQFYYEQHGRDSWVNDPSQYDGRHDLITTTYSLFNGGLSRMDGTEISATVNVDLTSFSNYVAFDFNNMTSDLAWFDPVGYNWWIPTVRTSHAPHVYYTAGAAVADDIVVHEYAHAVNYYEVNFLPYKESGAIDEAFCDLWGEWVDLTNGQPDFPGGPAAFPGSDQIGFRWMIGEDIGRIYRPPFDDYYVGSLDAAIRDLSNPKTKGHPAKVGDENWYVGPDDAGGVHTNCTVIGRLGMLLTDGGGSIQGLGILNSGWQTNDSAPALFYHALTNYLVSSSDFNDLYFALMASGQDLGMDTANIDLACRVVGIAPGGLTAQYDIIYRDRFNKFLQPTIQNGNITIADPLAHGTLVIRKKPGLDSYARIRTVTSAGTLTTLYSQANIGRVVVTGDLFKCILPGAHVNSLEVGGRIRKVFMDGFENGMSLDESHFANVIALPYEQDAGIFAQPRLDYANLHPVTATSINANLNGIPAGRLFPLSINLKGIGLLNLYAPYQPVRRLSASSKLWQTDMGYQDVSNAPILGSATADIFHTYPAASPSGFGTIEVSSLVGHVLLYGLDAIPDTFKANTVLSRRAVFIGRGIYYTPTVYGEKKQFYSSVYIDPDWTYLSTRDAKFFCSGGMVLGRGMYVSGQISQLVTKKRMHRHIYYVPNGTTPETYSIEVVFHGFGGGIGYLPLFWEQGEMNFSVYAAGLNHSLSADIKTIHGDVSVHGIFYCGVDSFDLEGKPVPDYRGRINFIGIDPYWADWVTPSGLIMGEAYVGGPIRRIRGDDTHFQVYDY